MNLIDNIEDYLQELEDYEDYLQELADEEDEEEEALQLELDNEAEQEELLNMLFDEQEMEDQLEALQKAYNEIFSQELPDFSPEDIPTLELMDEDFIPDLEFIMPVIEEDPDNPERLNFYMNPEDRFKMS